MTTSTINPALATVAASFGADFKALRSATVTAENKGNPAARSLLASLVSGVYTEALAVAAIIHSFGNPKGKNGKGIEKLSGLRNVTGGDAVRKMAESCFRIFANIDADAVTVKDSDSNDVGGAIRPLVTAFILNEDNGPKSLRALIEGVNSALRAYAKATATVEPEAADDADAEGDATVTASQSLNDRVLAVMVAYEAATPEAKLEAHEALAMLFDMVNADIAAEGDAEPVKLAA